MLHSLRRIWSLFLILTFIGCYHPWEPQEGFGYGAGGSNLNLVMPFPSGEYWLVTQTFGEGNVYGSHKDWAFPYGDDSYAIDFAQNGCKPFDKPVTPIADGKVLKTTTVDEPNSGYGNSVLVDHGDGYVSRYAHFNQIFVDPGDIVDTHTEIGTVGNTGSVSGSACPDHPGTHLHLAYYHDEEGVAPFPLSGNEIQLSCWYNREGDSECDFAPPDYEPVEEIEEHEEDDDDDDDEEDDHEEDPDWDDEEEDEGQDDHGTYTHIEMMEISPSWGRAESTRFIWSTVVESDQEPNAVLYIYNPELDHAYPFVMESWSDESPWIFTYEKTLLSPILYEYWVEVNGLVESNHELIEPEPYEGDEYLWNEECSQYDRDVEQNEEVSWYCEYFSDRDMYMDLVILNARDARLYTFPMEIWSGGYQYHGNYSQPLRDIGPYVFWSIGDNGTSITTTPVDYLYVEP